MDNTRLDFRRPSKSSGREESRSREMETRKKANSILSRREHATNWEFVWSGNYVLLWRIPFGYRSRLYRSARQTRWNTTIHRSLVLIHRVVVGSEKERWTNYVVARYVRKRESFVYFIASKDKKRESIEFPIVERCYL